MVFVIAFFYELLYYGIDLELQSMFGGNICQIAYWNILFLTNLAVSIGAAVTKLGQLVIAEFFHQAGTEYGVLVMQIGLCVVTAFAVYSLVMIATDVGGRVAGAVAFPMVASYTLHQEFIRNSYSIYLVAVLYLGLWLYFFHVENKRAGRLLLAASILFHAQAIAILVSILLVIVLKKNWDELENFSIYSAISLFIWVAVVLRVQGSLDRISCGIATGFPTYGAEIGSLFSGKLGYMAREFMSAMENNYILQFLFVLIFIGVLGADYYGYTAYLSVFSSLLLIVFNVLVLNGVMNIWRMWMIFYAFGCSVGIGTIVRFSRETIHRRQPTELLLLLVTLSLLVMTADLSQFNIYKDFRHAAVNNLNVNENFAASQRALNNLPPTTRLMTEDVFLCPVVATEPDRFKSLVSLQLFNISTVQKRKKILAKIDYILIPLNGAFGGYYIQHIPIPEWRTDPFRLMVLWIVRNSDSQNLYG